MLTYITALRDPYAQCIKFCWCRMRVRAKSPCEMQCGMWCRLDSFKNIPAGHVQDAIPFNLSPRVRDKSRQLRYSSVWVTAAWSLSQVERQPHPVFATLANVTGAHQQVQISPMSNTQQACGAGLGATFSGRHLRATSGSQIFRPTV